MTTLEESVERIIWDFRGRRGHLCEGTVQSKQLHGGGVIWANLQTVIHWFINSSLPICQMTSSPKSFYFIYRLYSNFLNQGFHIINFIIIIILISGNANAPYVKNIVMLISLFHPILNPSGCLPGLLRLHWLDPLLQTHAHSSDLWWALCNHNTFEISRRVNKTSTNTHVAVVQQIPPFGHVCFR